MRRGWTDRMQHGTDNGYTNGGCRCWACTRAHREARRQREYDSGRAYPWHVYMAHQAGHGRRIAL